MNQNDYIIAFDEKGKPYIAHSAVGNAVNRVASEVKNARGDRQNHKYILKIDENGRKRYFYTQDEVKAYYEEKKKQATGVVDKAKEGVKNVASNAKNAVREATGYAAGAVDKARDAASDAKDAASTVYNKAKDSANNTVTNAKNRFERMKSEFRDKTGQTLKDRAETTKQEAQKAETERQKAAGKYSADVNAALKSEKNLNANPNSAYAQAERDRTVNELRKSSEEYYKDGGALDTAQKKRNEAAEASREYADFKKNNSAQAMIDKARTAIKDKAEDLSAKAKSTAQAAKESVQGMIENARSSTAKAVNEAWDKIPKNADGTVNPFDSNFQSAYNDWKSKKDKYDGSLTGQAKAVAEKATDSVKDMIDQAKKTAKDVTQQISDNLDVKQLQKNLERDMKNHGYSLEDAYNQHKDWLKTMQSGQLPEEHKEYYKKMSELEDEAYKELKAKQSAKKYFNEYSDNDSDFAEKNYSKENRVADTDFYTFKRNDGKSVVLEEDMKWVLPKGVDAGDPAIKSALKKIANSGNFKSYDDWLENANDILGDAIEKVRDKEK